jgi:hypothetical protein
MNYFNERKKSSAGISESNSEGKRVGKLKRIVTSRHSLYPESKEFGAIRKSKNKNPFPLIEPSKKSKLDILISKISRLSDSNKNHSPPSIKPFKKSISRSLKSLVELDIESLKEKKEVVDHYSSSIKSSMYSISCSGKKYREARLKKHLSSMHIRKIFN